MKKMLLVMYISTSSFSISSVLNHHPPCLELADTSPLKQLLTNPSYACLHEIIQQAPNGSLSLNVNSPETEKIINAVITQAERLGEKNLIHKENAQRITNLINGLRLVSMEINRLPTIPTTQQLKELTPRIRSFDRIYEIARVFAE